MTSCSLSTLKRSVPASKSGREFMVFVCLTLSSVQSEFSTFLSKTLSSFFWCCLHSSRSTEVPFSKFTWDLSTGLQCASELANLHLDVLDSHVWRNSGGACKCLFRYIDDSFRVPDSRKIRVNELQCLLNGWNASIKVPSIETTLRRRSETWRWQSIWGIWGFHTTTSRQIQSRGRRPLPSVLFWPRWRRCLCVVCRLALRSRRNADTNVVSIASWAPPKSGNPLLTSGCLLCWRWCPAPSERRSLKLSCQFRDTLLWQQFLMRRPCLPEPSTQDKWTDGGQRCLGDGHIGNPALPTGEGDVNERINMILHGWVNANRPRCGHASAVSMMRGLSPSPVVKFFMSITRGHSLRIIATQFHQRPMRGKRFASPNFTRSKEKSLCLSLMGSLR